MAASDLSRFDTSRLARVNYTGTQIIELFKEQDKTRKVESIEGLTMSIEDSTAANYRITARLYRSGKNGDQQSKASP